MDVSFGTASSLFRDTADVDALRYIGDPDFAAQITGGLDPNGTVNAWGGPSYPGALLAHWLDCLAGFYGAAFLLSRLLLPAAGQDH